METPDNVVYIDEYKRERWLRNLQINRNLGRKTLADVIVLPDPEDTDDSA
jgi:type II secretory pathway component PulL